MPVVRSDGLLTIPFTASWEYDTYEINVGISVLPKICPKGSAPGEMTAALHIQCPAPDRCLDMAVETVWTRTPYDRLDHGDIG